MWLRGGFNWPRQERGQAGGHLPGPAETWNANNALYDMI